MPVFAEAVVMDSSNQMKVHSPARFVALEKQHVQQKQFPVKNVAMNVYLECNLLLMENVNHVQEEHTECKGYNHHAKLVHWAELHKKLALLQLKNVRCQSAHLEHT